MSGWRRSQSLQHQGSRSDLPRSAPTRISSLNPFNIREAGQTFRPPRSSSAGCLNPFNIREAGQTATRKTPSGASLNPFNIREAGQTIPSGARSSGPSLNPFNIREAGQTSPRSHRTAPASQSLQHQGSRSDRSSDHLQRADGASQSLQHQGSRSDSSREADPQAGVSIPSTSGKPVRRGSQGAPAAH